MKRARECTGAGDCAASPHIHGCYADQGDCDEPGEHGYLLGAAPVEYLPGWIESTYADTLMRGLLDIDWVQRDAPRAEYYCNDTDAPYTYGSGVGRRTYDPQPWPHEVRAVRAMLRMETGVDFDVCFLNRYDTPRHSLGWHADDSPEMDPARPVVTVSFGSERLIQFRRRQREAYVESLRLGHGSCAIMEAGMQQEWQHRIPKSAEQCGPRISLTFRGYRP